MIICQIILIFTVCTVYVCKGQNERTVVMDKSKGEPVISVKTKSKERVSNPSFDCYTFFSFKQHKISLFCSEHKEPRSQYVQQGEEGHPVI